MARKRKNMFIQKAIKHPGRVTRYMRRVFGKAAFTKDGTIKPAYLERAIQRVKNNTKMSPQKRKSLLMALYLAERLRKMPKRGRRKKAAR